MGLLFFSVNTRQVTRAASVILRPALHFMNVWCKQEYGQKVTPEAVNYHCSTNINMQMLICHIFRIFHSIPRVIVLTFSSSNCGYVALVLLLENVVFTSMWR